MSLVVPKPLRISILVKRKRMNKTRISEMRSMLKGLRQTRVAVKKRKEEKGANFCVDEPICEEEEKEYINRSMSK